MTSLITLIDDILNVFKFQQSINHRCNSGTQTSAVTWQTLQKHITADVIRSKKNSLALLVHKQQGTEKCHYIFINSRTVEQF